MHKAINPSNELPQPCPNVAYIEGPASGKKAPTTDRTTVFAATAEAAYSPKASTRYAWMGMRVAIIPQPIQPSPIIGMIQWAFIWADQPYQNRPIGTRKLARMRIGRRNSGSAWPLFFAMRWFWILSDKAPKNISPIRDPTPMPIKTSPVAPWLKLYVVWYTSVTVVKRR